MRQDLPLAKLLIVVLEIVTSLIQNAIQIYVNIARCKYNLNKSKSK